MGTIMDELQFVVHQRNNQLERANKRLREALEAIAGGMQTQFDYLQKYGLYDSRYLAVYSTPIGLIAHDALENTKPGRLPKEDNGEVK
jgi:hypothetical protein